MNIGSWDSTSIKTLLASGSTSSTSSSSIYDNLSELSSIKSGSYYKLAKKYYAENSSDSSSKSSSTTDTATDTALSELTSKFKTYSEDGSYTNTSTSGTNYDSLT